MVICLERCADLHMAQLMPLPLTVSCSNKIQIGFTFLVLAHLHINVGRNFFPAYGVNSVVAFSFLLLGISTVDLFLLLLVGMHKLLSDDDVLDTESLNIQTV